MEQKIKVGHQIVKIRAADWVDADSCSSAY